MTSLSSTSGVLRGLRALDHGMQTSWRDAGEIGEAQRDGPQPGGHRRSEAMMLFLLSRVEEYLSDVEVGLK